MSISLEDVLRAARAVEREQVVASYRKGATITALSREFGCSRDRIDQILLSAGIHRVKGQKQPSMARAEKCQRGHDMDEWGVEIPKEKGGGRYCRKCKQMRQRVAWKRGETDGR